MMYTLRQFGNDLLKELSSKYDPVRIAKWCYAKYLDERDLEEGLGDVMYDIYGMDAGSEFVIPYDELKAIAIKCCSSTETAG